MGHDTWPDGAPEAPEPAGAAPGGAPIGAGDPADPPCGCAARVDALEAAVAGLAAQVAGADTGDLRRDVARVRELLLYVGELIDAALTSA